MKNIVSPDAVAELQRVLGEVFERKILGSNPPAAPAWVLIPLSAYVPGPKRKYELRNTPIAPIVLTSPARLQDLVESRTKDLDSTQELAFNTLIVIGWTNGSVSTLELPVYDGAPGLQTVPDKIHQHFGVLRTGDSFHFYGKGRVSSYHLDPHMRDEAWRRFCCEGAGYIRLTHNVKGPIVRVP